MPCIVKKTLQRIIDGNNDYLVTLKQNQPRLYRQVEALSERDPAVDNYECSETAHGRIERRIISVWEAPPPDDPLAFDKQWPSLKRVIRVDRLRVPQQQLHAPRVLDGAPQPVQYTTHYYLTSRRGDSAYELATIIRSHWGIENRLHWVKDVIQHEDANRISTGEAAENLSLLKSWALTLFRINGHDSLKYATIRFANKIKELLTLIRT